MIKETMEKNSQVKANSREAELLKRDFPQCFGKDGKFDLQAFEELIRTEEVDIKKEGYSLDFLGKSYARYLASLDSETVIVPDEGNKSIDSQNVYIVGDNLDALQHLKYSYAGKIKCIYIDPPYNTGSDGFVYNDKFEFNAEELARKINIEEDEAQRVLDMQGKSTHSAWLTFMYPRLELAKELLTNDGVIFISIDDNEYANCKLLCDLIFGENNFINNVSVKMSELSGVKMRHLNKFAKLKESLLIYARNSADAVLTIEKKAKTPEALKDYLRYYSSIIVDKTLPCEKWVIKPLSDYLKTQGLTLSDEELFNWKLSNAERLVYRTNSKTVDKYVAENPTAPKICEFLNEDGKPVVKWDNKEMLFLDKYIEEYLGDIWMDISTINLNKETESITFENGQKPLSLIHRILKSVDIKGGIVMDFFSGSATTAHAVMERNVEAELNCRYIMVQIDEAVKKGSDAEKAGYKTIDEIGRDRIRRAAMKIAKDNPEKAKGADLGFKTYYLKAADKDTLDKIAEFNPLLPVDGEDIKSKFGADTVLSTWRIKDGYGFNTAIKTVDLQGYTAYLLSDSKVGTSLYLIEDMPEEAIVELVRKIEAHELNLDRIIEYGYAFGYSTNTALRSNLKTLKNRASIEPVIRY